MSYCRVKPRATNLVLRHSFVLSCFIADRNDTGWMGVAPERPLRKLNTNKPRKKIILKKI